MAGCEAAIADVRLIIAGFREKGITVTTVNVRAVFISQLTAHGLDHMLSPHLTDKFSEPDPSKLMLGTKWIILFLHDMNLSYPAVTGSAGKLPDNWEDLCLQSLARIAGKAYHCNISPERVIQADQTFFHLQPAAR
jgi:hypothetical protein